VMSRPDQAKGLHGSLSVGELGAGSLGRMRESGDRFGKITERRFDIIFAVETVDREKGERP